ncbi:MAG TPA: TIGR00300 family protein [Verrucomicrobiae bacterium]|nr:TIGR00300 family protein [Verrucomicrobiae bacterium]
MLTRRLTAEGHLIDSGLMSRFLNVVLEDGGTYEILGFDIGRTVGDYSKMELQITAPDEARLATILDNLVALGCRLVQTVEEDAVLKPAEQDGTVPDDFYSTTNHRTRLRIAGAYVDVAEQRMDAVLRVKDGAAACVKLRDIRKGDRVVCGVKGVQVFPPFKDRETMDFVFMDRDVSSERRVEIVVTDLAKTMSEIRAKKGRIVLVAGPVVVHTGGAEHMSRLIRGGFVQAILAGNALAVHDVERALYGTSLGVHLGTGVPVYEGHKNHMRAINFVRKAGGLKAAVDRGLLRSGVMFECLKEGVDVVLAGSIRDDGPMPETIMDLIEAQDRYWRALKGADLVLILSTMLHGIGTGNMTPSWVRTVCVDINPAVVTKLVDRGSAQAAGIVTDVGLFLRLLADELTLPAAPR